MIRSEVTINEFRPSRRGAQGADDQNCIVPGMTGNGIVASTQRSVLCPMSSVCTVSGNAWYLENRVVSEHLNDFHSVLNLFV